MAPREIRFGAILGICPRSIKSGFLSIGLFAASARKNHASRSFMLATTMTQKGNRRNDTG
jgi:hypothetical protein